MSSYAYEKVFEFMQVASTWYALHFLYTWWNKPTKRRDTR